MKKLLVLLSLFLSICIYAQTPAPPPPLTACDDNNDGFALFDLTAVIPMMLNGMNPETTTVTFYETFENSQAGINAVMTPNAYTNIMAFSQFIYLRIQDNANSQVYYYTFNLTVSTPVYAGTGGSTTICESSATPINLFNLITGEDGGGTWVSVFGGGGTLNSATGIYTPAVGATSQTFIYTVTSPGCTSSSSTATVNIIPQPNAGIDGTQTVCDTNTASINLFTIITGEQSGGVWTRTAGSGGTFNAAAGTYTPAPGATSSQFTYTIAGAIPCTNDSSLATININCVSCETLTPTNVTSSAVTHSSVNLTWVQAGSNPPTLWEILVLPAGSAAPSNTTSGMVFANNNVNYVFTGLAPNTAYDFYVRSVCASTVSDWSGRITVTTQPTPPICGGNFVDDGGVTGNYSNNANSTTTICPTAPGDVVKVTFTSFNVQANSDALYVYDGVTATPQTLLSSTNGAGNIPGGLAGGYWGTTIPGPFIASSQNGCLTFVFRSNASTTATGWAANVECVPAQQCAAPTTVVASNVTGTSAMINWTGPSNQNTYEILVLPQGAPAPTVNSFGVVTQSNSYLAASLLPNSCFSAYVRSVCSWSSEWSAPVDFCMVNCENNGSCAESLNLKAFVDANNNGIKDTGEIDFTYGNFVYQVNDSTINQYGTSNDGNYYIFDSDPLNSYDIQFNVNSDLAAYYSSSATHNDITIPTGSGSHTLYFPITITQPHVDAAIYITGNGGQPRPGFAYSDAIYYYNSGTQPIPSGTITFTKGSNVSIISTNPVATTATANGFTYNFTNLAPFESRVIYVYFSVPAIPTVALGDLVTHNATIQISNDANSTNNNATISQQIVGSYDPNDKMEAHGGKIVHESFSPNDYLYYTIQFENTGTANAEFIRVEDTLDNQLDANTFEMISSSHTVNTKREGSQLTWHFYDINLPATVTNPAESHGYVSFRIKPKTGFAIGDVIPNTAFIYFDYNPAIVTNTYNTEFVETLGSPSFNTYSIVIAPNPTSGIVTITNTNNLEKIATIAVYDLTGKKIYSLDTDTFTPITLDVSHFAKGLYLMELTSDKKSKIIQKLILK